MADIVPFRGVLFRDTSEAGRLLAPPYDVLSPADRERYAAGHPNNVVELDLPRGEGDAKYAHAAALWQKWRQEDVLVRDERPALYVYHQIFAAEGQTYTRKGVIALLKLEPFSTGGQVRPHERTLSGPKIDRLKLMRACHAHFSQIFMLYSDPAGKTEAPLSLVENKPPRIDAKTPDGVVQRLWALEDPAAIAAVRSYLAEQPVYIADGHHRYETMLALGKELDQGLPADRRSPDSVVHYGAVFLSRMESPGLVVLPTHRAVFALTSFDKEAVLKKLGELFTVEEVAVAEGTEGTLAVRERMAEKGKSGATLGLVLPGAKSVYVLTLKPTARSIPDVPTILAKLDVTVLHKLVLEKLLGITPADQESQKNLRYIKDTGEALAIGRQGRDGTQAVFLMNATSPQEVRQVADAGEVMPQKSTFFVPKICSGIVMNTVELDEKIWKP